MADRVEREIEEILRKIDDFVPEGNRGRRPQRRQARPVPQGHSTSGWFGRRIAAISLSQIMWWSLFVVLVSFFARAVPGIEWVMIGALIVFATAFFLSLGRGSSAGAIQRRDQMWRGQPMNLSGPGWPDRIKSWVKGRKRN